MMARTKRLATRGRAASTGIALVLLAAGPAMARDRWEPVAGAAAARLPEAAALARATLSCAGRMWRLDIVPASPAPASALPAEATLTVGGYRLTSTATAAGDGFAVALPDAAVAALRSGTRAQLDVAPAGFAAGLSLRGSRVAIDAAEARCSPPDMSAFTPVALSGDDPMVPLGRWLRADDMAAFTRATTATARVAAASLMLDGGRRLLFVELCGSSWYFGATGCNLAGYALAEPLGEWRQVYESEGALLHVDPAQQTGGWPNLVGLATRGSGAPMVWEWAGQSYGPADAAGEEIAGSGR